MDNNYNNTPDDNSQGYQDPNANTNPEPQQSSYQDPNAQTGGSYQDPNAQTGGSYQDPNAQSQSGYYQDSNAQAGGGYQDSNAQNQGGYQNQPYQNYQNNQNAGNYGGGQYDPDSMMDKSPMSLKDWIITLLLLIVPCVNIVMLFIWGFSKTGNINRRNFARAELIFYGILIALYLIIFIVFGASFAALFNSSYYY